MRASLPRSQVPVFCGLSNADSPVRCPADSFVCSQGTELSAASCPADVTRLWRDATLDNCDLRSQIVLQRGSGGSSCGGSGRGSERGGLLSSPAALEQALLSPGGWPLPMLL